MKNIIYLDSDFNFLLLENEEIESGIAKTRIFINIKTSAETNQRFEISVAGGAIVTENIASNTLVEFELTQDFWADNNTVEITPKNNSVTGDTITLNFPPLFSTSGGLNYVSDTEFDVKAQNENFAEGGSGSGSGSGGGSAFDFVETIRNIGFRLLDEPSNVNAYFDEIAEEVQIKWTDPLDIITNEPAPAIWAGTVVVRKEGSAPLHRWDGVEIIDSTTRDQYASNALIDNTIDISKNYYYGIFPYDTKGDYRFTKTILVSSQPIPAPEIVSLVVNRTAITVNYSVADRYTYDYITLVYKKNSAPADKTDGTAVSLSASNTSVTIQNLDEETSYYFKIFAQVTGASEEIESNTENVTTGEYLTINIFNNGAFNNTVVMSDFDISNYKSAIGNPIPAYSTLQEYFNTRWGLVYGAPYAEPFYLENDYLRKAGTQGGNISTIGQPIGLTNISHLIPINRTNNVKKLRYKAKTIKYNGIALGAEDYNGIRIGLGAIVNGDLVIKAPSFVFGNITEWTSYEMAVSDLEYVDYIILYGVDGSPGYKDIELFVS